jgi:hypothetical protein
VIVGLHRINSSAAHGFDLRDHDGANFVPMFVKSRSNVPAEDAARPWPREPRSASSATRRADLSEQSCKIVAEAVMPNT